MEQLTVLDIPMEKGNLYFCKNVNGKIGVYKTPMSKGKKKK